MIKEGILNNIFIFNIFFIKILTSFKDQVVASYIISKK